MASFPDLIITESDVTFPPKFALDDTASFTITIHNTPEEAGGPAVNEDFYIIAQLTPDSDINQNYVFEFLYPASQPNMEIAAASSVSATFNISFEYSYISKPLIGNPVAPTIGDYEVLISVNVDALGNRYVAESDYFNNSVRITTLEITSSLGNEDLDLPSFSDCRPPTPEPEFPPDPKPRCIKVDDWWSEGWGGGGQGGGDDDDDGSNWGWDDGNVTDGSGAGCLWFSNNPDTNEWWNDKANGGNPEWDPNSEGWDHYNPGGSAGFNGFVVREFCDDYFVQVCGFPDWKLPEGEGYDKDKNTPNSPQTPGTKRKNPETGGGPPGGGRRQNLCYKKLCKFQSALTEEPAYVMTCVQEGSNDIPGGEGWEITGLGFANDGSPIPCSFGCLPVPCPQPDPPPKAPTTGVWAGGDEDSDSVTIDNEEQTDNVIDAGDSESRPMPNLCEWWVYNEETQECVKEPIENDDCSDPISGYYISQSECLGSETNYHTDFLTDFMHHGYAGENTGGSQNLLTTHYKCIKTDKGPICIPIADYTENKSLDNTYSTYNMCTMNCARTSPEVTEVLDALPTNSFVPVNFVVPRHLN